MSWRGLGEKRFVCFRCSFDVICMTVLVTLSAGYCHCFWQFPRNFASYFPVDSLFSGLAAANTLEL